MSLPSSLKGFNLFVNGNNFIGRVGEGTEPKLTVKMEEWQGGGMMMPLALDLGLEKMEAEFMLGGPSAAALANFGSPSIDGQNFRFVGAYQSDDGLSTLGREINIRGRYMEIDFGNMKQSEKTEHKYKISVAYYRLEVNGVTKIEIDPLALIYRVNGTDIYDQVRNILLS